jgi:thiamine monophosphate kinase
VTVDAATVPVVGELASAMSAGDDYELLFTSRPSQRGRLRGVRRQTGDLPITRIGVVTKGRDVLLRDDQGICEMPAGYEHWAGNHR